MTQTFQFSRDYDPSYFKIVNFQGILPLEKIQIGDEFTRTTDMKILCIN